MTTFLANAIFAKIYEEEKSKLMDTREFIVNILLFGATVITLLITEGILPAVFNLESMLIYLITVEVYIFSIVLELHQ